VEAVASEVGEEWAEPRCTLREDAAFKSTERRQGSVNVQGLR
jgi:hypothetical protein